MPQCPRCQNRENILTQTMRGTPPGGKEQVGFQYFCPKCKLLETALDAAARAKLDERWSEKAAPPVPTRR